MPDSMMPNYPTMDTMRRDTARQQAEADTIELRNVVNDARQQLADAQKACWEAYDRSYARVYDALKDKE